MKKQKIIPVILSGGIGSRLWPLSRALYPKQLQSLVSDKSLLQETVIRSSGKIFDAPLVICNEEHRFIMAEHFREINIVPRAIFLEPIGRNTAPAAAVAAIFSEQICEDALLLVLPSDHVIKDPDSFLEVILTAKKAATRGLLVTLGTPILKPETGYGYIQPGNEIAKSPGCYKVSNFFEKPDEALATKFFNSGDYFWNSGIFMFSAKSYLNELNKFHPEVTQLSRTAVEKTLSDLDFVRLDSNSFEKIPAISIDHAVMEKSEKVAMVPAHMGWSDVGSWDTLWTISNQDDHGNVMLGDVITEQVQGSYIRSENKCVAALGLKNVIVVSTDDAVLVAGKEHAQQVKGLVERLNARGSKPKISRSKIHRPWGWYQSLEFGEKFQVKLINLSPGAKISLQRHQHRAEHWVVVAGIATVTRENQVLELRENQSTFISAGEIHRLENNADVPLQVIEVQSGEYLGEDDIERLDDQYGRV